MEVSGNEDASPLMFLSIRANRLESAMAEESVLQKAEDACWRDGVAVCVAKFTDNDEGRPQHPCLRVTVSAKMTPEDIDLAIRIIGSHVRAAIRSL
jgi:7-keto-8-aminopelargonate synthetase-like enzyme